MSAKHWFLLFAIGTCFGSSFAFNEVLVADYGPLTVSAGRIGFGAMACWVWLAISGQSAVVERRYLPWIVVIGIFQFAAPFAVLPLAQEHINSSTAGVANAMTPVAVLVISHFWPGGERATKRKVVGSALGLTGIVMLTLGESLQFSDDATYVALAVLAPVCYGVALNAGRYFRDLPARVWLTWAMTFGSVTIVPIAIIVDGVPARPDVTALAAFATFGIFLTAIVFLVMYSILPKVGPMNLSLVTFFAPVSALIIGYAVMDEQLTRMDLLGTSLVLWSLIVIDGRVSWACIKTTFERLFRNQSQALELSPKNRNAQLKHPY